MIKLEIKWYWLTLGIIGILLFLFTLYHLNEKSRWTSELKINQLKQAIDTAQKKTNKSVIEYRDRTIRNIQIVEKWNTTNSVDTVTNIDTLYLEAKRDINYLDTSLKKCEIGLNNCLTESYMKSDLIKALEAKKRAFPIGLGATAGVGIGTNGNGFAPHAGITFGLTFKK